MKRVKGTVVLIFTLIAFMMVSTGVSAATTCPTGQSCANSAKACYTTQCAAKTAGSATYTVKSGDSLYKVASACGTTVSTLKSLNCLSGNSIYPGQVLCTKAAKTSNCTSGSCATSKCTTGTCAASNCSGSACASGNCTTGSCATSNCSNGTCNTTACNGTSSTCPTSSSYCYNGVCFGF